MPICALPSMLQSTIVPSRAAEASFPPLRSNLKQDTQGTGLVRDRTNLRLVASHNAIVLSDSPTASSLRTGLYANAVTVPCSTGIDATFSPVSPLQRVMFVVSRVRLQTAMVLSPTKVIRSASAMSRLLSELTSHTLTCPILLILPPDWYLDNAGHEPTHLPSGLK